MKLKHCPECQHDLPLKAFTSTRAKYCISCKRVVQLKQQGEMKLRSMYKLLNKKPKTKTVVSIADLKKKVQRVFNAWIRERDKDLPCISCGKYVDNYEAGHYIAQGSSGLLRYCEENVNNQCTNCNRWNHGNLIEYRIGLVKKIGLDLVEYLEKNRHVSCKWTREDLEKLLEKYKQIRK